MDVKYNVVDSRKNSKDSSGNDDHATQSRRSGIIPDFEKVYIQLAGGSIVS